MRRILGMTIAMIAVLLQLAGLAAGLAAWRTEPANYLAPIDEVEMASARRA